MPLPQPELPPNVGHSIQHREWVEQIRLWIGSIIYFNRDGFPRTGLLLGVEPSNADYDFITITVQVPEFGEVPATLDWDLISNVRIVRGPTGEEYDMGGVQRGT